jgi:hypothetical protein
MMFDRNVPTYMRVIGMGNTVGSARAVAITPWVLGGYFTRIPAVAP